jgi:hypothetical protein
VQTDPEGAADRGTCVTRLQVCMVRALGVPDEGIVPAGEVGGERQPPEIVRRKRAHVVRGGELAVCSAPCPPLV